MRADADPAQVRERDDEADRSVTAHADGSDIVEEDHSGRAARIGGLAQQRSDQDIGSSRLVDDTRSKVIVVRAEALEAFRDAAAAEVRAPFDHHARGLAGGMRVDHPYLLHTHGASSSRSARRRSSAIIIALSQASRRTASIVTDRTPRNQDKREYTMNKTPMRHWLIAALLTLASAKRARRGYAQAGDRAARQLGKRGAGARSEGGLFRQARFDAGASLHPGRGRDVAGGDLGQRRPGPRRRHRGRAWRLRQGRSGARHRQLDDGSRRSVLVCSRGLADQVAQGRVREDDCLFHHRFIEQLDGAGVHPGIRRPGEARGHRQPIVDVHADDVGPGRHRLVVASVRCRSAAAGPHPHRRRAKATCRLFATRPFA